jgi:DNA polymerase III alpha subunit (gram-positive type)
MRINDTTKNETKECFFSVDIESTGLIPIRNSMLSIGAVAIRDNEIIDTFTYNIEELPFAVWDESTLEFWRKFPAALEAAKINPKSPRFVFTEFGKWVRGTTRKDEIPVFIAYPVTFDFTFCSIYGNTFAPDYWPFGFAGLEMQSTAAAVLNVPFNQARAKNWPKSWTKDTGRHPHIALPDAIQQAKAFINMNKHLKSMHDSLEAYYEQGNLSG